MHQNFRRQAEWSDDGVLFKNEEAKFKLQN